MFSLRHLSRISSRSYPCITSGRLQCFSFQTSCLLRNPSLTRNISYDELVHRVNNWDELGPHTYSCPVCKSTDTNHFHTDRKVRKFARVYFRCTCCALTFVPPSLYLSPSEEKIRYDVHINEASDERYRTFLRQAIDPLMARLVRLARTKALNQPIYVIDYGCGPGPAAPHIFKSYVTDKKAAEAVGVDPTEVSEVASRIECITYDPFFSPNISIPAYLTPRGHLPPPSANCTTVIASDNMSNLVASGCVDGVVATEVIEHAHDPVQLVQRLVDLLSERGMAVVMTTILEDDASFNAWGYRNDLTHVCFFKEHTMKYIAEHVGAQVERISRNVFLFSRREHKGS